MSSLPIYIHFIVMALAIGALVWSADLFVDGAAAIARNIGLSPLIIGLTVVSFGTSAPEILVSASAAAAGTPSLAVGNALGSNLANMGLVLAITALIFPINIDSRIAHREVPIMVGVTLFSGWVLWNGYLGRVESIALASLLVFYMAYLVKTASDHPIDPTLIVHRSPWSRAIITTLGGLALLLITSNTLVWSATVIAGHFGVSELIIGITIVAVGTSLPELAASVAGAIKGHSEMAIGNVIGSNIFNLAAVLPVAGLIRPGIIEGANFWMDFGPVLLMSALLSAICIHHTTGNHPGTLGRTAAGLMLLLYIGYYGLLLISATYLDRRTKKLMTDKNLVAIGKRTIEIETLALERLGNLLDDSFSEACECLLETRGRVIVIGMGKSGHIARKVAATLA
ncbi:MAG: calcium/sodium antiporter, partial [Pseudomonadales bacterium]